MVKLFWNTHNQINKTINDKDKQSALNYKWGVYHKENSDKWINYILKKINFVNIKDISELESKDTLVIVDSGIEFKKELYIKLKLTFCK